MENIHLHYDITTPKAKKAILLFFIKLLVMFTLWHLLYNFVLGPQRLIDRPLTNLLSASTAKCLNILSTSSNTISWIENSNNRGCSILNNNHSGLGIADNCNGIQLMFTYLSVIVLLPNSLRRKILFGLGGIALITVMNIVRICVLYYIYTYSRNAFDFSHHYLFTILMDILMFYGWMLFIKNKKTA